MSLLVRFEDDANDEHRQAARWYDAQQAGLGFEYLDAVDEPFAGFSSSRRES